MITVTVTENELMRIGACESGLLFFRNIANLAGTPGVLRVDDWSPLHDLWLGSTAHGRWLREKYKGLPLPDLRKISAAGIVLREARYDRHNARGADFRATTLTDVSFKGATLRRARFDAATLTCVHVDRADIEYTVFRKALIRGCYFADALGSATFDQAKISYSRFRYASLNGASFRDAYIGRSCFDYADIRNADMRNTVIENTTFHATILHGANFEGATIRNCDLRTVDFSRTRLDMTTIIDCKR